LPSPTIGKNQLEVDFRLDNIEKSPPDSCTSWSLVDTLDYESRDAIFPGDSHHPVLEGAVAMLFNAKTGTHHPPRPIYSKLAFQDGFKEKLTGRFKTALSTSKVLLVPYSTWHVPQYHEWMQDEVSTAFSHHQPDISPVSRREV